MRNGALAGFVEAVRQGRIAKGSVLVVESVDRLGRDQVADALTLFLEILRNGVEIATLTPERLYTTESGNDIAGLLEPIIYLPRAYEESATKSVRIKAAWDQKRKDVRSGKRQSIGKREPFWVRRTETGFELIPDQVAILQQMYTCLVEGYGYALVARKLNAAGLRTPRLGREWTPSSVVSVVTSRACLGEYHPSVMAEGRQVDEGEAITDYYPQAIGADLWYRAQHAVERRKVSGCGRKSTATKNLFSGLLFNALDGQPLYYYHEQVKTKKGIWTCHKLASKAKVMATGDSDKSVLYYNEFESAFLAYLTEIKPSDFVKRTTDATDRVAELGGKLVELDLKIQTVNKKLKTVKSAAMEPLLDLLLGYNAERDQLRSDLETLRAAESNHATDTVGMAQNFATLLSRASEEEEEELRVRLRQALKDLIRKIYVLPKPIGRGFRNKALYQLVVYIDFHNGQRRWFVTNQAGELIRNIPMPAWLKAGMQELKGKPFTVTFDDADDEDTGTIAWD